MSKYYQNPLSIESLAPDIKEQYMGWLSYRMGRFVASHEIVTKDNGKLGLGKQLMSDHFLIGRNDARDNALAELNASD